MASHTTHADGPVAGPSSVERLLQLCEEERCLYERVLEHARRQGEIVRQGGGIAALRRILGAKRACLEEIARLEAAQGVVRANAAGGADAWTPADQARLHVARARIATLVEEILACEERNDRELLDQTRLV
jgi:hypothetical protein